MLRMLFEKFEQQGASLLRRVFQDIDASQIEIRLIEGGRHANALLKSRDRVIASIGAQIQNPQIIQCLGVVGPKLECLLQRIEGSGGVVILRKHHSQAVVGFGIVGVDRQRALVGLASVIPALLLTICAAEIIKGNQMIGTEFEGLLKVADRIAHVPLARGDQAEVVPGICQGAGIARAKC